MKEESNSAWIDDVIKQHKRQLEELKRTKEQKEDNPFLNENPKECINRNNQMSQISKSKSSLPNNLKANHLSTTIDPTKLQAKINDLTLKLSLKKEKIRTLKQHNSLLVEDNESLKTRLNQVAQPLNANNPPNESQRKTISQLHQRIKDLESDLDQSETKIDQMSAIKSQEFDLMNQKIRDFEVIIDENSTNYISNMNKLNKTIDEYKLRIIEADKYVNVVNFFIQKIDSLYGNEPKEIFDYKELQNKFVEIEKIIMTNNLQYTNREKNATMKPLPQFQNKVLKSISGISPNAFDDNNKGFEDSKLQEEDLLEVEPEGEAFDAEKTSLEFRTLEERVHELENEMRKNQHIAKRKKGNDEGVSLNNSNSEKVKGRSKSSNKGIFNNEISTSSDRKTGICSTHKKIKKKKKKKKKTKAINTNTLLNNSNAQGKKMKSKYD